MLRVLLLTALTCSFWVFSDAEARKVSDSIPTTKELYEDCKIAIAKADKGDEKGFIRSYCAARITGLKEGMVLLSMMLASAKSAELGINQYAAKHVGKMFCFPKSYDQNPKKTEYFIAKDFITFVDEYESYKFPIPKKNFLENNEGFQFSSLFNNKYICRSKK